jgi:two-component system, OmpR family, sensor kinase
MLPPLNFRLRMMLLFCFVTGALMAATCATVYSIFVKTIRAELDQDLVHAARPMIADLSAGRRKDDLSELNLQERMLLVFDQEGNLLNNSRNVDSGIVARIGKLPASSSLVFRSLEVPQGRMRAALIPFESNRRRLWFVIAQLTNEIEYSEWRLRDTLVGIWVLSLLLTAVIAAWYVGSALRPITDLTRRAAALTESVTGSMETGQLESLPVSNPDDEVGRLASTFNVLFNRVDAVVRQLRQFVSDASHELRTPLSVLRGETHYLIEQERSPQEYQTTLRIIEGELVALTRIVEGLFTLSMADAGQLRLSVEPLYLDEVLEEACGIAAPGARRKNITIERLVWNEAHFVGDQALLRQLFLILLENAVKYSAPDTVIRVGMEILDRRPCVTVRDEGIGIAPEHLPHIFDRFYRAAPDPNEESRSGGLGLAIAQAIIHAHHGLIECASKPGNGSVFTLWFPEESTPQSAERAHTLA